MINNGLSPLAPSSLRPYTVVSHDSFARVELIRERASGSCDWCGQPARWRYGWVPDDSNRQRWDNHAFCSIGCFRSYYS